MAARSSIEWCDATWQVASGCNPISDGCRHCYSARLAGTRLRHLPRTEGLTNCTADGRYVFNGTVRFHVDQLDWMLRWRGPKNLGRRPRVFVADRSDLFHDAISDEQIDQVFAVMALRPDVDFLLLTKRSQRMREYLTNEETHYRLMDRVCELTIEHTLGVVLIAGPQFEAHAPAGPKVRLSEWPIRNVWLGVSTEDQQRGDWRIPDLLATPAAVRFVSAEPLLGAIDLTGTVYNDHTGYSHQGFLRDRAEPDDYRFHATKIDWVIVGGESGPDARPMHPDWVRGLRYQCAAAAVPFFFKQWGYYRAFDFRTPLPSWQRRYAVGSRSFPIAKVDGVTFIGFGKRGAGRLLDGVEHNGMPEARA